MTTLDEHPEGVFLEELFPPSGCSSLYNLELLLDEFVRAATTEGRGSFRGRVFWYLRHLPP
jgi:hypothetical protein